MDVRSRLDEGEEGRDDTDSGPRAEECLEKSLDRALQVGHRNSAVHDERLHLVEDRLMRRVDRFVPVDPAGRDDLERRAALSQLPDLHGRRVRAEEKRRVRLAVQEERVLCVARRMLRRKVQGLEVVEVVLDLGAVRDRVAHPEEDLLDPPADDRDGMERSRHGPPSRKSDVHGRPPLAALRLPSRELTAEPRNAVLDLPLGGVGPGAVRGPLLRRKLAHPGEERRDEPLFASEVASLERLELRAR